MRLKPLLALLIFIACFTSCTKNELGVNSEKVISLSKISPTELGYHSLNNGGPIINIPESYSQVLSSYTSGDKLREFINNRNEQQLTGFVNYLVDQIKAKTLKKYNIDLTGKDKDLIILFGLFELAKEKRLSSGTNTSDASLGMDCFFTAVVGVIGILDARTIWASITAGASAQTALAALSVIARRTAGVITVGIMVYQVGECMGWWSGATLYDPNSDPRLPIKDANPIADTSLLNRYNSHIPNTFYSSNKLLFNQTKDSIINYLVDIKGLSSEDALITLNQVYTAGINYDNQDPQQASLYIDWYGKYVDDYFHYIFSY